MRSYDLNSIYYELLYSIMRNGREEVNARTGVKIKAMMGGTSFKLDCSAHLPVVGNRKMFPHVAAAEVAWQFMGTQDPEFILKKAPKLWSNFVEDGKLKTAYGYRWREHFGRDQLRLAIDELANNPTNRQLFISAWDPALDGLGSPNQPKNIPCPVGFTVSALAGYVNMSVFIRSSDVFVGLPYDIMAYALTLDAIAQSAELDPGFLTMTLAHPHLYEPHFEMAEHCIRHRSEWYYDGYPILPNMDVTSIVQDPNKFCNSVKQLSAGKVNKNYAPLPDLVV